MVDSKVHVSIRNLSHPFSYPPHVSTCWAFLMENLVQEKNSLLVTSTGWQVENPSACPSKVQHLRTKGTTGSTWLIGILQILKIHSVTCFFTVAKRHWNEACCSWRGVGVQGEGKRFLQSWQMVFEWNWRAKAGAISSRHPIWKRWGNVLPAMGQNSAWSIAVLNLTC